MSEDIEEIIGIGCVDGKAVRRRIYPKQPLRVEVLPGWGGICPYCGSVYMRRSNRRSGSLYTKATCDKCAQSVLVGVIADNEVSPPKKFLSRKEVREIKKALKAGDKQVEIARRFGVTRQRIGQISKGDVPKGRRRKSLTKPPIVKELVAVVDANEDAIELMQIMKKIGQGIATQADISKAACLGEVDGDRLIELNTINKKRVGNGNGA